MGSGGTLSCKHCGYEKEVMLGFGMSYPYVCQDILDKMLQGEYGEKLQTYASSISHPGICTQLMLFQCESCHSLSDDSYLALCAPIGDNQEESIPFCVGMEPSPNPSYVMFSDIGKTHQVIARKKHICRRCNQNMKTISNPRHVTVACPKCASTLVWEDTLCWD